MADSQQDKNTANLQNLHLDEATGERVSKSELKRRIKLREAEQKQKAGGDSKPSKKSEGAGKGEKKAKGASYNIGLKDTENGVVTRFPPEPSGYLHIGHAKAALLNDYFAHEAYPGGTLLLRFDDTNPTNESAEFQDAITEDLSLMGIKPDKISHTSDYFQELDDYCVRMIKEGHAYGDDTERETMAAERFDGIKSKRRDESVEDNLSRFGEMKAGTEEGKRWFIRSKMSIDNPNKAMRDPVIYRCNPHPHHRTGDKWLAYPTYDFACPIVDSLEGVTHALRTIEYRDRNPQYEWFLKTLSLRPVHIWDFARMNFTRTLLSKRKLTKLVKSNSVRSWSDPRFPTIRGIRRRGCTIPALREFMLKQGPSKNIVNMDWTIFWSTNKKHIDPVAPRHTAIAYKNSVRCHVEGGPDPPTSADKPKHNKNPDVGTKKVYYSSTILLEQEDAQSFAQDEEITLMNWGNAIVKSITRSDPSSPSSPITSLTLKLHPEGDVKTTSKKLTWLSQGPELVPVSLHDFDFLITKDKLEENDNLEDFLTPQTEFVTEALADSNVREYKGNEIIQFERKGYYRCDEPGVFFAIPTGKKGERGV